MKLLVTVLCVLIYLQCLSEASRILAILPIVAKSHYIPFEPLFKRLAERGHELRVVSQFPQKEKIANLTEIDISENMPKILGTSPLPTTDNITTWGTSKLLWEFVGPKICEAVFNHPEVKQLLESDENFDLIISEVFATDCFLGFVHKFGVPYIGVSSCILMPWIPDILSNPENPSYIPQLFSYHSDNMNYLERFINAFYLSVLKISYKLYSDKVSHNIAKKYFGPELPSLDSLRSRVGLVLVNSHHSVSTPRALAPGVKEVGGIHIPISGPPQLPEDLKKYMDSAVEGVVYFSMGSRLNTSTFPTENMAIFIKAFAELPQRVLWICNELEMPQLPENVKCLNWAPQLSVLYMASAGFQLKQSFFFP